MEIRGEEDALTRVKSKFVKLKDSLAGSKASHVTNAFALEEAMDFYTKYHSTPIHVSSDRATPQLQEDMEDQTLPNSMHVPTQIEDDEVHRIKAPTKMPAYMGQTVQTVGMCTHSDGQWGAHF